MTKNVTWIWLAALLAAICLVALGCGQPSVAERGSTAANAEDSSSIEVTQAPITPPQPAPTDEAVPIELVLLEPELETKIEPAVPAPVVVAEAPVASPNDRESALDQSGRGDSIPEVDNQEEEGDQEAVNPAPELIPTDRFRAIPIERPTSTDRSPRETFEEVHLLVPAGTRLEIEFLDSLSSQENEIADRFAARVVETVTIDGYFAIPVGTEIGGEVVDVKRLRKIGGQARLALVFDQLGTQSGQTLPMQASLYDEGRNETRRDAAIIGGAAAAGAVVGRSVKDRKKGKGGLIGTILGAAVGAGIAAATQGEPIEVPAGTRTTLALEEDLEVTVRVRVIES